MKFAKIMMAAAMAAGTMFMTTGCGESPSGAFNRLNRAIDNGDLNTVNKYSEMKFTQQMLDEARHSRNFTNSSGEKCRLEYKAEKEEIDGDSAVVTFQLVKYINDKEVDKELIRMKFRKTDGIWKVAAN